MVLLAFTFGLLLARRRGRQAGIDPAVISDLTVWILVSSLVGARLTYVLAHLDEFKGRWWDAISPVQSDGTIGIAGLVILGGVATAIPTAAIFLRRKKLPFLKVADVMSPSLAFGIAIGRIGCFLNGCCFGLPTDLPWGVRFPEGSMPRAVCGDVSVHPTQLYETLYCSLIGAFLLWRSPRRRFQGELFYWFLALYGVARAGDEALRYYDPQLVPWTVGQVRVTGSMLAALAMAAVGALELVLNKRRPMPEAVTGGGKR